jgi:hypothetical protein
MILAAGGAALALSLRGRGAAPAPDATVEAPRAPLLAFDGRDLEAAARMLASENPSGPLELHVEQLYTQVRRALAKKQSLYQRITGGIGYGPQGTFTSPRGSRPVSTANEETPALRVRAELILRGTYPSQFPGAGAFFEPAQQDRAFALAEKARAKLAAGEPLTDREKRLLGYKSNAADIRRRWAEGGQRYLGTIDGVEFWTP